MDIVAGVVIGNATKWRQVSSLILLPFLLFSRLSVVAANMVRDWEQLLALIDGSHYPFTQQFSLSLLSN